MDTINSSYSTGFAGFSPHPCLSVLICVVLELPCIPHAKLELAAAAVESVVVNRDAVVEADWPDRQIEPEADAPVVAEIIQGPLIGGGYNVADIVEECESHTHSMLLLDNRDAVFYRAKPVGVAADRLGEVSAEGRLF